MPRKTGSQSIKQIENRKTALEMRKDNYTLQQIADKLGCTKPNVYVILKNAIKTLNTQQTELTAILRDTESGKLDRLEMALSEKVEEGDVQAIGTFIRIIERRAKLYGLDAPSKVDLTATAKPYEPPQTKEEKELLNRLAKSRGGLLEDE